MHVTIQLINSPALNVSRWNELKWRARDFSKEYNNVPPLIKSTPKRPAAGIAFHRRPRRFRRKFPHPLIFPSFLYISRLRFVAQITHEGKERIRDFSAFDFLESLREKEKEQYFSSLINSKRRTINSELVFIHRVALRQSHRRTETHFSTHFLQEKFIFLSLFKAYYSIYLCSFVISRFFLPSRVYRSEDCFWNESFRKRKKKKIGKKEPQRLIAIITGLDTLLSGYKRRFQGNILGFVCSKFGSRSVQKKRGEFYSRQHFYGWQLYPSRL